MNNTARHLPSPACFYSHSQSWHRLTERMPTLFESATADALWKAYEASRQVPDRFKAVSAATGSGKTLGAIALIAHLWPGSAALVIREIKEARKAYRDLCRILGDNNVALYASRGAIAKFEDEQGEPFGRTHTDDEFRAASVVVCTHARWKAECMDDRDRGVRLCDGVQRNLIVIDEEPELECVYVAQPEDVSTLASVLSDRIMADEARAYDFSKTHAVIPALNAIHQRMRSVKDNKNVAQLLPQSDLVSDVEASAVLKLTRDDIYRRLGHLPPDSRIQRTDQLDVVREFLVAACDGRVFFSKGYRGEFYAYSYTIPPQRNTIILDGTADLNGLYGVGQSLITLDAPAANYEDVKLHYVELPKEFSGQTAWKPEQIRRVAKTRPLMNWLHGQIVANTSPGERVLVYAPKVLIDTDIHNELDWQGREVNWQHFGSGRGTNDYKDFTVYFQLRAFYKPKGAIVAQTLSHTGERPDGARFKNLSSGRTTDPVYVHVRDTLIACDTKQNAARTCIRQLGDDGKAKAARLYFVSDNLTQIERYQDEMFPGAGRVELIVDSKADIEGMTGPERLAYLLSRHEGTVLEWSEIMELTGIAKQHISKYLQNPTVRAVMRTKGWQKSTRKSAGLAGKGLLLRK